MTTTTITILKLPPPSLTTRRATMTPTNTETKGGTPCGKRLKLTKPQPLPALRLTIKLQQKFKTVNLSLCDQDKDAATANE
jgi:hypothetical protein